MKRGLVVQNTVSERLRKRRRRCGRRWRRPAIAAGSEPHDRRFRSRRSIGRSADRRSCRRDDARRQSYPPRDRRRCCRNAPRIAQGYIADPDRPRPDCACTSHTRRPAVPHSRAHSSYSHKFGAYTPGAPHSSFQNSTSRIQNQSWSPQTPALAAGNGGRNSADNGDDEFAPPRSSQMQTAKHSRQQLYAYYLPSCCFRGWGSRCDQRPRNQG